MTIGLMREDKIKLIQREPQPGYRFYPFEEQLRARFPDTVCPV